MFTKRIWIVCGIAMMMCLATVVSADRVEQNFNRDWRFIKGERDAATVAQPAVDDAAWETVQLPHDWAISGPFDPKENGWAGKLPWRGVGWYRKSFALDAADKGRRVYLDFDGVMAFPKVYVNGQLAGEWDYGYMSFRVDATPFVKFGEKNTVAVCADTRKHGTRWYPGAGIYRKVTLTLCDPVHVSQWGIYITTPEVKDSEATVRVQTSLENHVDKEAKGALETTIFDPDGKSVATIQSEMPVAATATHEVVQTVKFANPQRWDIAGPKLYTAKSILKVNDRVADSVTTPFGIRSFEFKADDGFHLNGRRVQLYGVCLHHDQGPLGGAFFPRAMERQLEIMRDMGVNAIRTSHNPPAPELLDLCDRMGFVVWDECFDKWDSTADRVNNEPLEQYGEKQIRSLVLRDRNHPSIVIWSIANEINNFPYDKNGMTPENVKFMGDFVRKYDLTRPVGMACHIPQTVDLKIIDSLDLTGWNYNHRYDKAREKYPDKPIIYSESASALSTYGFYELPLPTKKTQYSKKFQVDSYDLNAADWSDIADREFDLLERDRFVAGEFVWTGFDYLGEPTPFSKEARSSYFGIVDLCGIPKDRFFLYRSYWRPDTTTIHILPHWNWPDRVGRPVPVFVYTNGDSAELFLNGKSLGRCTKLKEPADASYYGAVGKYRLRWMDVPYEPGELKAVAYKGDTKLGEAVMRTAGAPAAIRLTPDRTQLAASGEDLSYILVEALDDKGVVCPLADNEIAFTVDGPARLAAVGNGDPMSLAVFTDSTHPLFFGRAVLIVRSDFGETGPVKVTASSEGLKPATVELQVSAAPAVPGTQPAAASATAPKDAIVLFDGKDFSQWTTGSDKPIGWKITDGAMHVVPGSGSIMTRRPFGDFRMHLEFRVPLMPDAKGQARGNSGVYIQRRYELQILDSFGEKPSIDGCGSIYKTKAPDVNACLAPMQWQSYDIQFTAPRWQDGKKIANARITVVQNGKTVQNDFEIPNKTGAGQAEGPSDGPIVLQEHNNQIEFRNVWIVPLDVSAAPNTLSADEKKAGFKLLFDGKSTAGWRGINSDAFPAKGWIVKDGMIVGNPPEDPAQRGGGDIVTVETFGDFELSLECRLGPASNSGIKYLVSDELSRKAKSGIGLEFQLIDETGWRAKDNKLTDKQTFGAIYDIKTPDNLPPQPVGQWIPVRIVVKGSHLEHWVSGRKVIDADRSSPEFTQWITASKFKNMAGFAPLGPTRILLQDHPGTVAFRSIKLRLLQP
jgi:beta-galactosidase